MAPITINGNKVDPAAPVISTFGINPAETVPAHHVLMQAPAPLSPVQKDKLEEIGLVLDEYVSTNTYLCHYEKENKGLDEIRNLGYWAQSYPDKVVVHGALKESPHFSTPGPMARIRSQPKKVDIVLHDYLAKDEAHVKADIAQAAHIDGTNLQGGARKVRATVDEQYLQALAHLPEVRAIVPVHDVALFNNVARGILNADVPITGSSVFTGAGEIVAVADSGIDKDHPAFGPRVIGTIALGRTRPPRSDDPKGHGTRVSGSIIGDADVMEEGRVRGTAYEARLYVQSILDDDGHLGGIPPNLNDLFKGPYSDFGARVYTNSWGVPATGLRYSEGTGAREIDEFVFEHKDMVICYAAGNEGEDRDLNGVVDLNLIGAHAAAKNNITVGASESARPMLNLTYGELPAWDDPTLTTLEFLAQPLKGDLVANDPDGMVAFSSRGPTREHRIKPDVVAPGSAILSAKSRITLDDGGWGTSPDDNFKFDSGTSMACPLVAGCAAAIRQALREHAPDQPRRLFPTAALVKGLLINGAVELPGQYVPTEAGPSPNSSSGWGRVDLSKSIILNGGRDDAAGYIDADPIRDSGPPFFKRIPIPSDGSTLKVTLVWTDSPGPMLQNNLNLIVHIQNADGEDLATERHGNMGTGPDFDTVNNVEQVLWQDIPSGTAVLEVRPDHFGAAARAQDFALVWTVSSTE